MSLESTIKNIQNQMRKDAGINGNAQRIEQLTWMLFLKIYDQMEQEWAFYDENYKSIIPEKYQWSNWAVDYKDGKALTGDELIEFIGDLFKALKELEINRNTPMRQAIVVEFFRDIHNDMKNGISVRKVLNYLEEIKLDRYDDRHALGDIYEQILKDLQGAKDSGEFYTPRPLTDFMAQRIKPQLGEKIGDFACGTGGFLTSALKILYEQVESVEDKEKYDSSIYGVEKKSQPYMLCVTNMILHDIESPNIYHGNSFNRKIKEYNDDEKFDVILMNPPYGGEEDDYIQNYFPKQFQSSETADLFLALIMYRLKKNGRAAVVLPDSLLFGSDNAKINIKKHLLENFNLHTVVRLPKGVFVPYTSIATNVLFFENTHKTEEVWFYRIDPPKGKKNFTKTQPLTAKYLEGLNEWWDNREEIIIDGVDKARKYSIKEIVDNEYDLDLCKFSEKTILNFESPEELIREYLIEKEALIKEMNESICEIKKLLNIREE